MSTTMSVKKDLQCIFNMPQKIGTTFEGKEETTHALPPYASMETYPVDEYSKCPSNWMHGSDIASSYFIGIKENYGMWLDFNGCFNHTYDVAIVISVQGVNPITGQKMVGKKALYLQQYHKKCPIHKINFKQDRYCEKCGFKWPGQNYLCTTGTRSGLLWLDGFRSSDGKIRQYIFTADEMRGIASQLIGKERVFAIGIAFYISKNKRPEISQQNNKWDSTYPVMHISNPDMLCNNNSLVPHVTFGGEDHIGFVGFSSMSPSEAFTSTSASLNAPVSRGRDKPIKTAGIEFTKPIFFNPVKQLEIGAGALISQRVYDDPKEIKYWEEKPAGMLYINYCDEETLKKILDGGKRADKKDGFMQGLQVGG